MKVMHAAFNAGETALSADDGMGPETAGFKGVMLLVNVPDDAQARRVFDALGKGRKIDMALTKTF